MQNIEIFGMQNIEISRVDTQNIENFGMQNLEISIFDMQNLEISRFDRQNLEISIFDMQNLEISRFDIQNLRQWNLVVDCVKRLLKVKKNNSVNVTYINIIGPTISCLQ